MISCKIIEGLVLDVDIRGFSVKTDCQPDKGGENTQPEPPELMHASLLTCTATFFLFFCRQHELDPTGVDFSLDFESAEAPKRITKYDIHVKFPENFPEDQLKRAKAYIKSCPVANTLKRGAEINYDFE